VVLKNYKKEVLEGALEALNAHIISMGATITNPNAFDPYKSQLSSSTGDAPVKTYKDAYDPAKVINEIDKIKKDKEAEL